MNSITTHRSSKDRIPTVVVSLFARGCEVGYATMEAGSLAFYGVKTIPGPRRGATFRREVERRLNPIISLAEGGVLVVERIEGSPDLGALAQTLDGLVRAPRTARTRTGRTTRRMSLGEVKNAVCRYRRASHGELADAVQARFPALRLFGKASGFQATKYRERCLIAVGMAETMRLREDADAGASRRRRR